MKGRRNRRIPEKSNKVIWQKIFFHANTVEQYVRTCKFRQRLGKKITKKITITGQEHYQEQQHIICFDLENFKLVDLKIVLLVSGLQREIYIINIV